MIYGGNRGDLIGKLIYKGKKTTAIHPAYYVRELIKERNMSVRKLIKLSGVSKTKMKKFMKGKINLDNEIAYSLSNVFNTSIILWVNLQTIWLQQLRKIKKENGGELNEQVSKNLYR